MTAEQEITGALVLRLLGSFEVQRNGASLPRLRAGAGQWLLALLTLRHDRETSRAWLAATLWPESQEPHALYNLRRSLSDLRHALGSEARRLLSPTPRTLRLDLSGATCDLLSFDAAIQRGDSASLQEALALYRGPLLEGCTEEWVLLEREAREQAYLSALEVLAQQAQEQQNFREAARLLRLAVTADPFHESAWRSLMQALADHGDHAAVALAYRELREVLHREMNAEPASETHELFQWLQKQARSRDVDKTPFTLAPQPSLLHLPRPLTSFIGREKEMAEVGELLKTNRLVTITGAGGVGKTRLALRVAETVIDTFPDGAWFADFAPLSSPSLVVQVVAKALGVQEEPGRPLLETLTAHLHSKCLLLLLDNCEHLREACAHTAKTLLGACPGLKVLATSRQALGSEEETAWHTPSLTLPDARGLPSAEEGLEFILPEYEAPRLFVERALGVMPAFVLTKKNAPATLRICRRLDGIPLAIELAAARVRTVTPEQILSLLQDRFRLLTYGGAAELPRQQTLRAAIDWSYDLLSEAARTLLRRLSVFAGGWTLEAVEKVCAEESEDTYIVLDLLSELVDRSLVVADEVVGEERRYRLLETIREYSWERLRESEEEDEARNRHLDYYLGWAEKASPQLLGPDQQQWFARLDVEHDNLRAALSRSVEEGVFRSDDFKALHPAPNAPSEQAALRLTAALCKFWMVRGHTAEAREWYRQALGHPNGQARTKSRASSLITAGMFAVAQADFALAQTLHEEGLAVSREIKDRRVEATALTRLAVVYSEQSYYAVARDLLEEALVIVREDGWYFPEGTNCMNCLALVALHQKEYVEAEALLEQALTICRAQGNPSGEGGLLDNLGHVARCRGDYDRARMLYKDAIRITAAVGAYSNIEEELEALGCVAAAQGEPERAARLFGASEALQEAFGTARMHCGREDLEPQVAALREALGEAALFATWNEGRALTMEQAIAYALEDDTMPR